MPKPGLIRIAGTDLSVFPLCLGGNVFGWTADEEASFAVLDAYVDAGGNFVDTADSYQAWVPGHEGGESERIIGRWMAARGNRDSMIVATKVGRLPGLDDLRAATIRKAVDNSLERLQIDCIDLYYAHGDDHPEIPLEETLGAFDEIVRAGKVRYVAASNYEVPRLAEALAVSRRDGLAEYVALQTHYNLLERGYEDRLRDLCASEGLPCLPYFALAMGFLTGKYRPAGPRVDSPRSAHASRYLDARGLAVLGEVEAVAKVHGVSMAAVALAWLRAQPTVALPIASARSPEQLADLLPIVELDQEELERLSSVAGQGDCVSGNRPRRSA